MTQSTFEWVEESPLPPCHRLSDGAFGEMENWNRGWSIELEVNTSGSGPALSAGSQAKSCSPLHLFWSDGDEGGGGSKRCYIHREIWMEKGWVNTPKVLIKLKLRRVKGKGAADQFGKIDRPGALFLQVNWSRSAYSSARWTQKD